MAFNKRGRAKNVDRAAVVSRRTQATKMRIKAYSWQEIADACGYSTVQAAQQDVMRNISKEFNESSNDLRELELRRIDEDEKAIQEMLMGKLKVTTRLQCIDRLVKLREQRAKLLGLNAPVKVDQRSVQLVYEIEGGDEV